MLGTARPGVTIALRELERRGWITHRRGIITIVDRKGLIRSANGAYVASNEK
jgi:DNA-binding FadR family transcriptional regulator